MREITIEQCETLPDKADLEPILLQYYELIVRRMHKMGFEIDDAAPESALAEFWGNAGEYLPPRGCLLLAKDSGGEVVGCGMLRRLDETTGELKRVFVMERARGTGTGRRLIEAREAAARAMGLTRIVADTLTPNVEMRDLYPKLGFVELDEPIETTTYHDQPQLRPYMHYFAKDLV